MSFTTELERWRALTVRDRRADGQFVYTVKSTNVYCRPSCPARLARRANIGFCVTPAEAEAAGFRACKRCKPQDEIRLDPQEIAVAKACTLIEESLKEDKPKSFRLQDLAKDVGFTPRYFHKIFKDKTGFTPKEYAKSIVKFKDMDTAPYGNGKEIDMESVEVEDFNFNDLVDLDFDGDLSPVDNTLTPPSLDLGTTPMIGQEENINSQSVAWNETLDYYVPVPELDPGSDKQAFQFNALPVPTIIGLQPYPYVAPSVSEFDLDAIPVSTTMGSRPYPYAVSAFDLDAIPVPTTVGLQPYPSTVPAVSAFDLDAVFLLGGEMAADMFSYVDVDHVPDKLF